MNGQASGAWGPERQRLAGLAILSAIATSAAGAAWGDSAAHFYGGAGYIGIAIVAVLSPSWIPAQVIAGQLVAASLLLTPGKAPAMSMLFVVAAVIATAELLAAVARMETSGERGLGSDLGRTVFAACLGGAVFGAIMLLRGPYGPSGLLPIGLASGACVLLAMVLASASHE